MKMKLKESEIRETIRETIKETFSDLREAEAYKQFFMDVLDQASDILGKEIDSPEDMTDEEKAAFFSYVDTKWDDEKGEKRDDVDVDLRDMLGESYIRSRVREAIKDYVK